LRSPANAKRLFASLEWSDQRLSKPASPTTIEELRSEMEGEVGKEEAAQS
jgi:antitoxin YefM